MRTPVVIVIILLFITYGVFRAHDIFFGSSISFEIKPASSSRVSVTGTAPHNKTLSINGETISISSKGLFLYDFSPLIGLNVITIESTDTFGNMQKKTHSFVYKYNEQAKKTAQR